VLRGIAPQLKKGDAAWVNLESPLSTLGSPTPGKDYTFEGPPSMAKALAAAGVTVVTLGNNHTVDYGQAALADTIKRLEKAGVQVVGAGLDDEDAWTAAIVKTSGGATIGFLAWSDVLWPGYRATSKPGVQGRQSSAGPASVPLSALTATQGAIQYFWRAASVFSQASRASLSV